MEWSESGGPEMSKQPQTLPRGSRMGAAVQFQLWWLRQKCSSPKTCMGRPVVRAVPMALVPTLDSAQLAPGPKFSFSAWRSTLRSPQVRATRPSALVMVRSRRFFLMIS